MTASKVFRTIFISFIWLNTFILLASISETKDKDLVLRDHIYKTVKEYVEHDLSRQSDDSIYVAFKDTAKAILPDLSEIAVEARTSELKLIVNPNSVNDSLSIREYVFQEDISNVVSVSNIIDSDNGRFLTLSMPVTNYKYLSHLDALSGTMPVRAVVTRGVVGKELIFTSATSSLAFYAPRLPIPPVEFTFKNDARTFGWLSGFFFEYHKAIFCILSICVMAYCYHLVTKVVDVGGFLGSMKILNFTSIGFCITPTAVKSKAVAIKVPESELPFLAGVTIVAFTILLFGFGLYLVARNFKIDHDERSVHEMRILARNKMYNYSLLLTLLGCSPIVFYMFEVLFLIMTHSVAL